MRVGIQIQDAGKVARIAYVHRVCNGLHTCLRRVCASEQIVIEYIVGIVCGNEAFDRKPHPVSEKSGGYIAEIAARHTDHELRCLSESLHTGVGIEIIECLRQESGHIDRVG